MELFDVENSEVGDTISKKRKKPTASGTQKKQHTTAHPEKAKQVKEEEEEEEEDVEEDEAEELDEEEDAKEEADQKKIKMMMKIKQSKNSRGHTRPKHQAPSHITDWTLVILHWGKSFFFDSLSSQLPSSNLLFMDLNDVDCDWSLIKNACAIADPSTVIIMGDGLLNLNLHLAAFDSSSVNLDLDHIHIFTIHPKVISSNRGKKQPVNNTVCTAVFKSTTSLKSFHHHPDELPEHLLHLLHKWDPRCALLPVPSKSKFEENLGPKTAVTVPTKPVLIYELLLCLYTKEKDSIIDLHPSTGCMAFACLAQKCRHLAFSTHFLDNEKERIIQRLSALTVDLLEDHIIQRGLAFQQQFKSSSLPSSSQSSTAKSAISKHAYLVSQRKRKMKKKNKEESDNSDD